MIAVLAANVEPWQGMVAVAVLAGVVGYLFQWADKRVTAAEAAKAQAEQEHVKELGARDTREASMRAEYEARGAAQARDYAEALRRDHADHRAHEDMLRKEFVATVAMIGEQTAKSAESLTEVLGKLHDRFGPPRAQH